MVAGAAAPDLIERHTISLGTIGAVSAVVIPSVWWLSSHLKDLQNKVETLQKTVDSLPCPGKTPREDCEPPHRRSK